MADLYEDDILLWSERQADLLRRRATGELVNEAELDWPNIAEEIESVGRSELRSVESHLVQALLHDPKAEAWPLSRDVPHWRAEARGHRADARRAFAPLMRRMPDAMDGQVPAPVPQVCPATLEALLAAPDAAG